MLHLGRAEHNNIARLGRKFYPIVGEELQVATGKLPQWHYKAPAINSVVLINVWLGSKV